MRPALGLTGGASGWVAVLLAAACLPLVAGTPYYLSTAILTLVYVTLAVAFDLVVGRIGALSLAQPVFYGFGAYAAALLSVGARPGFWIELLVAAIGAPLLALAIGIPSFRLSLHSFAIGTLGFALIAQLIATNWIPVTGGPLCITAIPPLTLGYLGGSFRVATLAQQYYVILAIAALAVLVVAAIARSRLGLAFTAVRDDPVLAAARGLWPTQLRLAAFAISAILSSIAGAFVAHFQGVVCPTEVDISITVLLLIIVFIGGRGSLRGVVTAAVVFTVVPELLRLTKDWRLVIFGALLLVMVTTVPDGFEHVYARLDKLLGRRRAAPPTEPDERPGAELPERGAR